MAAVAAGALLLALAVVVGRWEERRWVTSQVAAMKRIRAAVGPLDTSSLIGYRVLPTFDCLVYRRGKNPFALELCVDHAGRVVEAIDRRGAVRRYYSLRSDPAASTFRLDRKEIDRLLRMMGAKAG
jgi:hypothetical protein